MNQDRFLTYLKRRISTRFDQQVSRKKVDKPLTEEAPSGILYESFDEYTAKTGKRFRMTKEEKSAGLTREEAFHQRFNQQQTQQK